MDDPRPGVTPKPLPEGWPTTAVGFQRQQRKAKRYITVIALTLIVGPVGLVLLGFLFSAMGSGSAWSLVGIPFMLLGALISLLMPVAVVAIFAFGAWALFKAYYGKPAPTATALSSAAPAGAPAVAHPLAAEVALLEQLRLQLAREARRRTYIFVPLGIAAAALLFFGMTSGGGRSQGSPTVGFIVLTLIGGGGAWIWAVSGPGARYTAAFKSQLLPRLLTRYGELRHQIGRKPDLGRAVRTGFLPVFDSLDADDAFVGSYRGHPIAITEIEVARQSGDREEKLFQGLHVAIGIATPFRGTTITRDRESRQPTSGLQRLRLEDPVFEEVYATWSSDEVEGRAVLTPAVMERLLVMADGKSFLPPQFLLDGDRMVFALPSITPGSLFEPPGLETHAAAEQLASLEADLATVFALADAMIDMHLAVSVPPGSTDDHAPGNPLP